MKLFKITKEQVFKTLNRITYTIWIAGSLYDLGRLSLGQTLSQFTIVVYILATIYCFGTMFIDSIMME